MRDERNQRLVIDGFFVTENELRRVERDGKLRNVFANAEKRVDRAGNRVALRQNRDADAEIDAEARQFLQAFEFFVVRKSKRRRFNDDRNGAQRFRQAQRQLEFREKTRVVGGRVEEKNRRRNLSIRKAKTANALKFLRDPFGANIALAGTDDDFRGGILQIGELAQTFGERNVRKTTGRSGDKQRKTPKN